MCLCKTGFRNAHISEMMFSTINLEKEFDIEFFKDIWKTKTNIGHPVKIWHLGIGL